jgi:hypothetical protein
VKFVHNFGHNSEGKVPFGRRRDSWEGSIKRDLKGKGCKGVEFSHLIQDTDQWQALLNTVINIWTQKEKETS